MAWTQLPAANAYFESQALSRSAPTTDATDGVPLKGLDAFTAIVEANVGQTLSGSGSLVAYLYDDAIAEWYRCPGLDVSVSTSGVRRVAYNFTTTGCRAVTRILYATSSVTVSGGTTVTIYLLGGRSRGG